MFNIFKKKESKTCGWLDINGVFYRDKENRDNSNYGIEYKRIDSNYKNKCENIIWYNEMNKHSIFRVEDLKNIDFSKFVDYYFEKEQALEELKEKYGL